MILGVTPTVDYAFKHVFGRERTIPILMSVLDSVLAPAPGRRLLCLELLNPFNPKEALDDKLSILDITMALLFAHCRENGNRCIAWKSLASLSGSCLPK